MPFIGKTIAAARISFLQHNEALKKRAEARARPGGPMLMAENPSTWSHAAGG